MADFILLDEKFFRELASFGHHAPEANAGRVRQLNTTGGFYFDLHFLYGVSFKKSSYCRYGMKDNRIGFETMTFIKGCTMKPLP